jgi:hypothetical protein
VTLNCDDIPRRALNVHERHLPVGPEEAGQLLETLAGPGDRIWTSKLLPPISLSDGLNPGSAGGHGPVRYRVGDHEPGRRVRFIFDPECGITGWHEFVLVPEGDGTRIRHTLSAEPHGKTRAMWPMVIKSHDAGVEDIFDNLERSVAGTAHPGQRTSRMMRTLGPLLRTRRVTPATARCEALTDERLTRIDFADAWTTPLMPDDTDAAEWWVERIFAGDNLVSAAMRLRNAVVRPFGIRTVNGFPRLRAEPRSVILGVDDSHLRFRVAVECEDKMVTVTTAVMLLNKTGRIYWLPVRVAHPFVVRRMLARVRLP